MGPKSRHDVQSEAVLQKPPEEAARPLPGPDGRARVPEPGDRPGPLGPEQQTLEQLLDSVRRLIRKYNLVEMENQELRRQAQELRQRAEVLEQENQRLRSRLEQLEAERDAIRLQVTELVRELESLELE